MSAIFVSVDITDPQNLMVTIWKLGDLLRASFLFVSLSFGKWIYYKKKYKRNAQIHCSSSKLLIHEKEEGLMNFRKSENLKDAVSQQPITNGSSLLHVSAILSMKKCFRRSQLLCIIYLKVNKRFWDPPSFHEPKSRAGQIVS